MRKCIYCRKSKSSDEFTLEHIIPQFLGGAQAPDEFKTKNVCKICNNNLGLFVDAAFEKDFFVFTELNKCAHALVNPQEPVGLPLRCWAISDLNPPHIKADALFGYEIGELDYSNELYKALWFERGNAYPEVRGAGAFSNSSNSLKEHGGVDFGTTIAIIPSPVGVTINLNLNRKMNWAIVCAKLQDLTDEQIVKLEHGICIVLFKSLKKGFRVKLPELINHNLGNI